METQTAPPQARYSRPISGSEKVAVLLLALERELATQLLHRFEEGDIHLIRTASEQLKPITADDLTFIVEEFAQRFGRCVDFIDNPGEMQQLLTSALGRTEAEAAPVSGDTANPDQVWQTVRELEEDKVVAFLAGEHPQTGAVLLARTGPQYAALIMARLPDETRDGLVRRLVNMRPVGGLAVAVLESGVAQGLLGDDGSQDIDRARAQLANIINLMDNDEKNAVLDALLRDKPAEAEDVKRRLFSFEDIEGLPDKSRLTLFDKVSTDNVVLALQGASSVLQELALSSLSARTRRMVEAELKRAGDSDEKQIADARRAIAATALQLAESGDIVLRVADED